MDIERKRTVIGGKSALRKVSGQLLASSYQLVANGYVATSGSKL
jgi:hypothetical protein